MSNRRTHTTSGIKLLRAIASKGVRIFTLKDIAHEAKSLGIKKTYYSEMIHHLTKDHWIRVLKKGIYAFTASSGMSQPPHEFEIAQALVSPSAISYWTAMDYHQITQQMANTIYSQTPHRPYVPKAFQKQFMFHQVSQNTFFGIEEVWIERAKIHVTDLEKTLLDGLSNPKWCGGFEEVYNAFRFAQDRLDIDKIIDYALRCDTSTIKRLGWMLDQLGYSRLKLNKLFRYPIRGFRKLDVDGPNQGTYDHNWMLILNV